MHERSTLTRAQAILCFLVNIDITDSSLADILANISISCYMTTLGSKFEYLVEK